MILLYELSVSTTTTKNAVDFFLFDMSLDFYFLLTQFQNKHYFWDFPFFLALNFLPCSWDSTGFRQWLVTKEKKQKNKWFLVVEPLRSGVPPPPP